MGELSDLERVEHRCHEQVFLRSCSDGFELDFRATKAKTGLCLHEACTRARSEGRDDASRTVAGLSAEACGAFVDREAEAAAPEERGALVASLAPQRYPRNDVPTAFGEHARHHRDAYNQSYFEAVVRLAKDRASGFRRP